MAIMSDKIYDDLKRQYDLVADRRKILTSQAVNIMGFAGIINTVLIALMLSVATNNEVRLLISNTLYYHTLIGFALFGFVSYLATAIFALFAYWEPMWVLAPQIPKVGLPNVKSEKKALESLKSFLKNPSQYNRDVLAYQLQRGIEYNQKINDKKYANLKCSFVCLLVGIGVTTIGGIILISTVL